MLAAAAAAAAAVAAALQCEPITPPRFSENFPLRLRMFDRHFTCLLNVHIYVKLKTFI